MIDYATFEYYLNTIDFNKRDVAIFGLGEKFKNYYHELKKDINIKVIIDNNKEKIGKFYDGIKIVSLEEYSRMKEKFVILISTHFDSISTQLKAYGFKNNEFFDLYKFVQIWYWKNQKKIYMFQGCFAVTTKCTLRCKNCAMFIPRYTNQQHRNLTEMKEDLDALFNVIDKIYVLELIGGEPFLNSELGLLLDYIYFKYIDKIGKMVIFTNGTVIPAKSVVEKIKSYKKIEVFISNYTKQVNYLERLNTVKEIFRNNNIKFNDSSRNWFDLGIDNHKLNSVNDTRKHMLMCEVTSRGIYNKRLYYCHISWSAARCGLLKYNKDDYIELDNIRNNNDQIRFIKYTWGIMKNGNVSLCDKCNGFGGSNIRIIPAGIQEEKII